MDPVSEIRLLLQSGHSLIAVATAEEQRLLRILREASGTIPLWTWSRASGLSRDPSAPIYGTADASQMLSNLLAMTGTWTAALCDPAPLLADPTTLRQLKELGQRGTPGQTVVLVGNELTIHADLDGVAHVWRLPHPTVAELVNLIERITVRLGQRSVNVTLTDSERIQLARSLTGITLLEAERQLMAVALIDGRLDADDIAAALSAKAALLNTDGVLEIVAPGTIRLDSLGGLMNFKVWVRERLAAGLDRAVDPPRGALLTGVPGCGKSALAHAIAQEWSVPLVLLDPGRIYRKYVGESEKRFDSALATVAAMAPAVLWIDEIEKGFASGNEDGGVSGRILGTFLRWLQDRAPGVFVVATANDVSRLPPELTRKGRFDEVFFVDLPDEPARLEILRSQLSNRSVVLHECEIASIASQTDGHSGAELEAAIVAASYRGVVTEESLSAELAAAIPLSRSRPQEIASLRAWAREHARAA